MSSHSFPCVVIPIYKDFDSLDESEITSLNQSFSILFKYPFVFVGSKNVDSKKYLNYCSINNITNVEVKIFDEHFFSGIQGYNDLLVTYEFYAAFKKYSHILIYQLDAYVFKDELMYWADQDIDYIGAPWFEAYHAAKSDAAVIGVGNGGFSLRRISTFLKATKYIHKMSFLIKTHRKFHIGKLMNEQRFLSLFKIFVNHNYDKEVFDLLVKNHVNEDFFWGLSIPKVFDFFKTASFDKAFRFSFEVNPKYLFALNNNQLPFGCHAWLKYDKVFFNSYIK